MALEIRVSMPGNHTHQQILPVQTHKIPVRGSFSQLPSKNAKICTARKFPAILWYVLLVMQSCRSIDELVHELCRERS